MLPNTASILEELIRGLSDEELGRKLARDRFSVGEVIAHLEHVERTLYGPRLRSVAENDRPALPAYKAPATGFACRDTRTTLESYSREREANSKLLAAMEPGDL